ncbi:helix-turn-helix domain-containing protein [Nonomuraea sp. 10N515B]|uniref:helix-turn-helix domain-containing protein n=1 Tax=Nonomuraea sp. 10N515B TaxID=3457422 RepID=UPI003FCE565C
MSTRIVADFEQARPPQAAGAPHPALRPLLARAYSGYRADADQSDRLRRPATTSVSLILKIQDSAHRPPAFVHGAHDSCATIQGACAPSYLEVRLAPIGAYVLLGVPVHEFNASIVDLRDLLGPDSDRLVEKVRAAPDWAYRFRLIDEHLLHRTASGPRPASAVAWAWQRLLATSGTIPIRAIAAEVGWSNKHLIDKFRQQVGLPPKTVARLIRFNRLLSCLDESPLPRWERIAADCGYADQAHLVRDFREFAGTTPTGFLDAARPADRVHRVQDEFVLDL